MRILSKLSTSIILSLILFALGVCLCVIDPDFLSGIYFLIIATIISLTGIIKLSFVDRVKMTNSEFWLDIIEGCLDLIIGILFGNFMDYLIVDIILGIAYLSVPIARFFFTKHLLNQFIIDIFKYYVAITIFCGSRFTYPVFFKIIGVLHIVLGIIVLLINYFQANRHLEAKDEEL